MLDVSAGSQTQLDWRCAAKRASIYLQVQSFQPNDGREHFDVS